MLMLPFFGGGGYQFKHSVVVAIIVRYLLFSITDKRRKNKAKVGRVSG